MKKTPISPEAISRMLEIRANMHRAIRNRRSRAVGRTVNRSWQIALIDGTYQFCMIERVPGSEPGVRWYIRHNKTPKRERYSIRVRGVVPEGR